MPVYDHAMKMTYPPKDRSLWTIAGAVVLVHFLFLLWAMLANEQKKLIPPLPAHRLVVQTVQLQPGRQASAPKVAMQPAAAAKKSQTVPEILEKVEEVAEIPAPLEKSQPKSTPKEKDPLPEPIKAELPTEDKPTPVKPEPVKPEPIEEMPLEAVPPIETPVKPIPAKAPAVAKPKAKAVPKKEVTKKDDKVKPSPKKAVAVNKVSPKKNEISKKESVAVKPPAKKSPTPAVNAQEKIKKAESDKAAVERQKKIEAELQATKAKQQKLLSQAQETIAKIDRRRDKVSGTNFSASALAASPGAISSLHIDGLPEAGSRQQLSSQEVSYRDELAGRLKLLLKLPEYGEVKIKLILERSGKVAKVTVLSAESVANRKYIEKTLPTLSFPAFGANFDHASQFTFSITLCNDL